METYSILREFADSWMLLALFSFFVGVVLWVLRPGSRQTYSDTAEIPFRNESKPAQAASAQKEA
jgi:cytochrome c oxidase cbb3-type subunit 4